MRYVNVLLIGLAAALLGGCGSGGGGPQIRELSIYPPMFTARPGDVVALAATATYADGRQAEVTTQVTWRTSSPAIATVSSRGVLTMQGVGHVEVTASRGNVVSPPLVVTVEASPQLPTAPYLPLGLNYYWEYTGTEVSSRQVRPSVLPITLIQSVPRQVVRDGSVWWELQIKGSDPLEPPSYLHVRHDPQGLMRSRTTGYEPLKLLDASLALGAQWVDPSDPHRSYQIESISDRVEVPAGTYDDCVRVAELDTAFSPPSWIIVWFKAGVGIVKEQVYEGETLISEQKLVRVQLGRP